MAEKRPEALAATLRRFLDQRGFTKRVGQATALEAWPRVVGPAVAAAAHPLSVTADGTLIVGVKTAAWMNELCFMERELLEALNRENPTAPLSKIRWTISP